MLEAFIFAILQGEKKKIVAVLPKGGPAAKNPKYLNCVENGLGLREWLESLGHTYITTADKEPPNSGDHSPTFGCDKSLAQCPAEGLRIC